VPPGNGVERDAWEGTESFDTSTMSSAELAEYEEKKVRMLRAMGDKTVELPSVDGDERREKLRAALERDDWSAVVDEQTSLTAQNSARNENSQGAIVTPFARASVHRSVGNVEDPTSMRDMTVESVDAALDDVRPYLMADGGNVEVVSVEGGVVALELQGACGTCPSSSATMKMGIERALRAAFGEQLKEVLSVGGASGPPVATEESVDMHLNMLRGAVAAYGGSVEVDAVESGVATLRYNGPKPIGYGIVAAVKDKFPDLRQIIMLDAETGEPIQF
jgi:Fe-S cluster biogenesis protein NfuA